MKFKRIVGAASAIVLIVSISMHALAATSETSIASLLKPYEEIIEQLNNEFGCTVYIPENLQEEVYENLQKMTLSEFEEKLRNQLDGEFNDGNVASASNGEDVEIVEFSVLRENTTLYAELPPAVVAEEPLIATPVVQPLAERDTSAQTFWFDNVSFVKLYSTVWSSTGNPGSFIYESIDNIVSGWIPGSGQFFYVVTDATYSLNAARTVCTVLADASKRNDDGLYLLGTWKFEIPFYSSETD